ncbi:cytochrome b/b6 domain-containing protein [Sphingomonas sp. BE137]|jgi:cytochrome b|uniref:cytochrome b/b6 domain-containing protein n=1 Tax=Sphingomonas sp. BE137 TaxID=2817844 RepID=UPI001AE92339|nr:cytochrome b/b6 domain-containing protein [Sphingomonas sp. BE137]MDR6846928.1 cytochrome b [Sphingomonas sp. BE137]
MAEVGAAPLAVPAVPGKVRVRVWDPLVRIFHWTVAGGVIANLTFLRHEKAPHIYVGYAVVAALVIRLGWGFVARGHARFASFVPGPRRLLGYFGAMMRHREPRYVGHNPAGAAMIVLLMALLATVGTTGWMMGLDAFWGIAWVETLHEVTANLLIGAVALHVIGAIVESVRHRENLPLAMITGYKRAAEGTDIDHAPVAR